MKLDFGLSNTMLTKISSEWKDYQFGITYSVTLSKEDLETTLAIRNTGTKDFEFQTLLHSYWAVDVSLLDRECGRAETARSKTLNGRLIVRIL